MKKQATTQQQGGKGNTRKNTTPRAPRGMRKKAPGSDRYYG